MKRIVLAAILAVFFTGCKKAARDTSPDSVPPPTTTRPSPTAGTPGGASPNTSGVAGGRLSGQGGGGGIVGSYRAARRTQALAELSELGKVIALLQVDLGRMPTKEQILADLKKSYSKLYNAVNEGAFILTGTMDAGGLWAYEVDADTMPGFALIGGTASKTTPEELKRYFPAKQ